MLDSQLVNTFKTYETAALKGCIESCYQTGNCYNFGEGATTDKEAAFVWYFEAAKKGHTAAQHNIALMYRFGIGIEKNEELATHWYIKASDKGYTLSTTELADLYYNGTNKDFEKAYELFESLAELGINKAIYNIGRMYENGDWVYQSDAIAIDYYQKAAMKGHIGAKIKLEKLTSHI